MGELIFVERRQWGRLKFAGEKETLPRLGERIKGLFDPPSPADKSGLYLISANAGFHSAVEFWSAARRSGLGVANPELFPWTLANAPGGWLARTFGIAGPNFTYTGGTNALLAALTQAREHLLGGDVVTGWVVALDFAQTPNAWTTFAVLRLSVQPSPLCIEPAPPPIESPTNESKSSVYLRRIFQRLAGGENRLLLANGSRGFYLLNRAE
jgi:hypothetical protein